MTGNQSQDPDGHRLMAGYLDDGNGYPLYFLLNTATGGNWGGQMGIDNSLFPLKYTVDYLKYYQWE